MLRSKKRKSDEKPTRPSVSIMEGRLISFAKSPERPNSKTAPCTVTSPLVFLSIVYPPDYKISTNLKSYKKTGVYKCWKNKVASAENQSDYTNYKQITCKSRKLLVIEEKIIKKGESDNENPHRKRIVSTSCAGHRQQINDSAPFENQLDNLIYKYCDDRCEKREESILFVAERQYSPEACTHNGTECQLRQHYLQKHKKLALHGRAEDERKIIRKNYKQAEDNACHKTNCASYFFAQFPVASALRYALMNPSRSPSITAPTLPLSKPVRWSLTRVYGINT